MIVKAILLQNSLWNQTNLPLRCKRKPPICLQINAALQEAILMQCIWQYHLEILLLAYIKLYNLPRDK